MSKKTRGIVALAALCGLSLFLLNCGSTVSRSSGLLYVLSQGSNAVGSYAINLTSGSLSLVNSNAATDSTPSSIVLDPTGTVAFVLNTGSNDITAYTIAKDGSLTAASGNTPITVQNASAMASDPAGKFLFVVSQGSIPLPTNCPLPEPDDTCPHLSVFAMQSGSTTLAPVGQPPSGTYPFQLDHVPTALTVTSFGTTLPDGTKLTKTLLYVTNAIDLAEQNDNTVVAYQADDSGLVTEQPRLPYATASDPSAALTVSTAPIGGSPGLFLYVTNVTTHNISVFQVCTQVTATCGSLDVTADNNTLIPVTSSISVGDDPVAMVVDPTGNFLYVASKTSNQVFGFRVNPTLGTLSALSPASMNTGLNPISLAMHSSGKFLFVANNGSSSISSFLVDTTSGAMSSPQAITSLAQPSGMAAK